MSDWDAQMRRASRIERKAWEEFFALEDIYPHRYAPSDGAPCLVCGADWKNPIHEVAS